MSKQLHNLVRVSVVIAALTAAACGSNSPNSPTSGSIASVAFAGATLSVGATIQGTVTLASAAGSNGVTVGLSSSNSAVASVPASISVAAGATTGTFSVMGLTPGTATVTATLNGSSLQSSGLTVSGGLRLSSITVNPTSVVGGTNVTATVTLSGPAPSGGAAVTLSSDMIAVVPALVTVISGDTSASFNVLTQVVTAPTTATINAAYGGSSATASIALTRATMATANFGVTGRDVTETCAVINGGTALDCTFNASTSSAPGNITAYDWTWAVTGNPKAQTTSSAMFASPPFSCSMLPPPPLPAAGSLTMIVTLQIHDDAGNVSAVKTDNGVRLLPQGSCGY